MKKQLVQLLILLIFVPQCSPCVTQEIGIRDLVLLVFEDGFVEVSYIVELTGEEIEVNVPLLGEPEDGFIIVTDQDGLLLNYEIKEGTAIVESLGAMLINITYHTKMLTKMEAGIWTLNITSPSNRTTILLPENSIVMGISSIPTSIYRKNGRTALVFSEKGVIWVSYVIELKVPVPTSPEQPSSTSSGIEVSEERFYTWFIPVVAGFIFILFLLVISLRRPRRVAVRIEELPYVDRLIIEELKERGGSAFQSELIKALDLPKTTVWRHLKGLEEEGLIEIRKIRGMNHIRLKELG